MRPAGVYVLSEITRTVDRVHGVDLGGQQANLAPELLAAVGVESGEQAGFCGSQAIVEGHQEPFAAVVATTCRARRSVGSGRRSIKPAASRSSRR